MVEADLAPSADEPPILDTMVLQCCVEVLDRSRASFSRSSSGTLSSVSCCPRYADCAPAPTVRARFQSIPAQLHRAPRGRAVAGLVVEGPVAVAAGLEARPAAVLHAGERCGEDSAEDAVDAVRERDELGRGG